MRRLIKSVILRAIRAAGYTLVRLPVGEPAADLSASGQPSVGWRPRADAAGVQQERSDADVVDHFREIDALLSQVAPWSGQVPAGFAVDFLGTLTDESFLWNRTTRSPGGQVNTAMPTVASHGEGFFEIADWFYAARDARDSYVAISLGAAYGAQLVGAWKALQAINPMPARLVAVEPVPQNCDWVRQHMANNGIDPGAHWIVQAALSTDNEPVLFPVGAPGTGLTESVKANAAETRAAYAGLFARGEDCKRVLKNILLYNSTGVTQDLGLGYEGEIKFVSALTLDDVLAPFDRVDLLEIDLQQAEGEIIAPCMGAVNRKVKRVHIGTHGREIHAALVAIFRGAGWEIVFDYASEARHSTARGSIELGDGILTARNPRLDATEAS